jgi:hypothetical protein
MPFWPIALNDDGGLDRRLVIACATRSKSSDDAHGVRNLLPEVKKRLLADELCDQLLFRARHSSCPPRKPCGAFGEMCRDKLHEGVHVEAHLGRNDQLIVEIHEGAGGLKLRGELLRI